MIQLGSVWLAVFLFSAIAAVLDSGVGDVRAFALARGSTFGLVFLTSPLLYVCLLSPRLPKSVFLPPLLFIPFSLCGGMPLPLWVRFSNLDLAVSVVQLVVAVLAWLRVRVTTGQWMLKDPPAARAFAPSHVAQYVAICWVVVPLALIFYAGSSAIAALDHFTGGFVSIDAGGVHAEERQYTRGDVIVRLIPMVHVGRAGYYQEVLDSLPVERSIILAEGMRDEGQRLSRDLSYAPVASALGLEAQESVLAPGEGHHVVNADLDVSAFSPHTLELVESAALVLSSTTSEARAEAWGRVNKLVRTPGVVERAADEVIGMRNRHLLERMDESLASYAQVVVPWGAAHMPELEEGVIERGFELSGRSSRSVVLFER